MNWLGQRLDSESYNRWQRKYYHGRMYKNRRRGRRSYRGPGTKAYRRSATVAKLRKDVAKLKKGQVGREWKTHDDSQTSVAITNTGSNLYCLTEIAQGDRSVDREGLKINLQSIWIKMLFGSNTTHNSAHEIRIMIFRDNENANGDDPPTIAGDLLEDASILDFSEHRVKGRYRIYYDKLMIINPNVSAMQKQVFKKYYKKFKTPKKVFYSNNTATDEGKGQFYLMMMSNTATNEPTVAYKARLKFTG